MNAMHDMQPLGWQGTGIDWEIARTDRGFRAEGYDEDVLCHVVTARTRFGLHRGMRRALRVSGHRLNSVLGTS